MPQHAVLTAVGADRPGLVESISRFLLERRANIEDSRMVNLRGQFAIMLLISAHGPQLEIIAEELEAFAKPLGLRGQVVPVGAAAAPAAALPYRLSASAMDQAGLVHRVSAVLTGAGVNIESLESRLTNAPITGAPLFEMDLILSIPQSVSIAQLRNALGQTCDAANIDWQLAAM